MLLHAFEQYDAETACYSRARKLDPDSLRWAYYSALAEASAGRRNAAVAAFKEALNIEPNYVPAQIKLAETLLEMGEWETSATLFEKLTDIHLAAPLAYYGLGRIQIEKRL